MNFANVKSITIPEGKIKRILSGSTVLWKGGFTNLLPKATDIDRKTIYNGVGYANSKRWSESSAAVVSAGSHMAMTGFIPCKAGDILRVQGFAQKASTNWYIIGFNEQNAVTGLIPLYDSYLLEGNVGANTWVSPGYFAIEVTEARFGKFSAVRVCVGTMSADTIITINEEIT